MITRRSSIAAIKRFLKRRGIIIDRYTCSTSPDLQLVRMLTVNGIDLVLDVGANTGGYAKAVREAGYRGRILSFEPLSTAHAQLAGAAAADRDWTVAPRMALGDSDETVKINIAGNSASSSILSMTDGHTAAAPDSSYVGSEPVDVRRLDDVRHPFLDAAQSPFLKIDTQGYETQVLAGAARILPKIRGVQLEMSLSRLYEGQTLWRDVITVLEDSGFELWGLIPGFFNPTTGRMLQCDGVFFRS